MFVVILDSVRGGNPSVSGGSDAVAAGCYPISHHVLLPCQLVWQEAEVGKLDGMQFAQPSDFNWCVPLQAARTS